MRRDLELWDPFRRRKFHSIFDDFFPELKTFWLDEGHTNRFPLTDILDEGNQVRVVAELPGVEKNDIKVDVTENQVSISAEHKQEQEKKGKQYYHQERSFESFHRTFSLPEEVLAEKAKASFKNGVLELVLPKKEVEEKQKKYTVKIE